MKAALMAVLCLALAPLVAAQTRGGSMAPKVQSEAQQAQKAQQEEIAAASVNGTDEQRIRQMENLWDQSWKQKSGDLFASMQGANFSFVGPDGHIEDKKFFDDNAKAWINHFDKVQTREVNIQMYGNTAVVTGVKEIDGKMSNGQSFGGQYDFTHVWVKQSDGKWAVVRAQLTKLR